MEREAKRRRATLPALKIKDSIESSKQDKQDKPTRGARQYHCDYCRKDISTSVRIRCAECSDFDLCLECFSVGVEVFAHKNSHRYRVIEHVTEPVFDKTWGADEEMLLLEGISTFGYGNWSDIAEHVGTKSRFKCQSHYNAVFLNSPLGIPVFRAPLADPKEYRKDKDARADDRRLSVLPSSANSSKKKAGGPKSSGKGGQDYSFARSIGYAALREDFDVEYDNDAEQYLADMEICETDTDAERQLKLKVIQIYNQTLDERERRKKFILERDLLFPHSRKRTREEKIVLQNMSCFARFQTKEEHESLVQGLLNEQRIRTRIEQLQQHRLHGIRTLAEGDRYEAEKKKRDTVRREKEKLAYLYTAPRTGTSARRRRTTSPVRSAAEPENKAQSVSPRRAVAAVGEAFELSAMEDFEKLSANERIVCDKLQLRPRQFVAIKESLLNESYRRGFLRPGHQRQLLRVDINKTDRAFDFFVSSGWEINTDATKGHPRPQKPSSPSTAT